MSQLHENSVAGSKRSEATHRKYLYVFALLVIVALSNTALSSLACFLVLNRPEPPYFLVGPSAKLDRIRALSKPVVTTRELLQWAAITATTLSTYNFVNWREVLGGSSRNFTPSGWEAFQVALEKSGILQAVISKKLSVSAVSTGAAVVLRKGFVGGVFKWRVQFPLLVTYESASNKVSQQVLVTMLITRISTADSVRGIAIESLFMVQEGSMRSILQGV